MDVLETGDNGDYISICDHYSNYNVNPTHTYFKYDNKGRNIVSGTNVIKYSDSVNGFASYYLSAEANTVLYYLEDGSITIEEEGGAGHYEAIEYHDGIPLYTIHNYGNVDDAQLDDLIKNHNAEIFEDTISDFMYIRVPNVFDDKGNIIFDGMREYTYDENNLLIKSIYTNNLKEATFYEYYPSGKLFREITLSNEYLYPNQNLKYGNMYISVYHYDTLENANKLNEEYGFNGLIIPKISNWNIREEPDINSAVVDTVSEEIYIIYLYHKIYYGEDYTWYQIHELTSDGGDGGNLGWVAYKPEWADIFSIDDLQSDNFWEDKENPIVPNRYMDYVHLAYPDKLFKKLS